MKGSRRERSDRPTNLTVSDAESFIIIVTCEDIVTPSSDRLRKRKDSVRFRESHAVTNGYSSSCLIIIVW